VEQKSPPHLQSKPVRPSFFLQTPHFAFLAFLGFEMVVFEMVVFEMVVFDASSLAIFGCGEVSNTEFSISGVGSGVFSVSGAGVLISSCFGIIKLALSETDCFRRICSFE